jgi:hypothetical protein
MSAQLRGKPVTECNQRLKLFLFAESGCGKSYFCTQFPKTYYIDCERRIKRQLYVDHLNKNGSVVWQTDRFDDLLAEIKTLASVKHNYQTLVVDSITPIYTKLVDDCHANLLKLGRKLRFSEEYQEANKRFKKLTDLLQVLDMNVIVTAHSKANWEDDKANGTTFDAYKKFDYYFEVVMEAKLEKDPKKDMTYYKAVIKKSTIVSLAPNHKINFSYDEFKRLYDKELQSFTPIPVIEAEEMPLSAAKVHNIPAVKTKIKVLSEDVKSHLMFLMGELQLSDEVKSQWFDKLKVSNIEELSEAKAQHEIQKIEAKYPEAAKAWMEIVSVRQQINGQMVLQ